ncbi:nickel-dependent hydrogenase large subunit [uncultured Desulfobacter sp.]|uniref:nickel-dependent hydrogenase large subunit n=1 Tax=uncultured Desulfobacter sp. TaxID=240139 RepID=UPI0029F5409B|nr:nickel-dependent hydrogenase large subunit [uncultured Desulfobacter sp.]
MKIDIGPVTRLEGHLNVNTVVEDHVIVDAKCMGEMFRGFEAILKGWDPLDAQQITQRICGVCPYAHGIASSYAQENAYQLKVPRNGRIQHNLIQGANHLYDYLLHFYQLSALDFVTAILQYKGADPDLTSLKNWVDSELNFGSSFPGAPFLPRLSGKYIADAELNIGALKHYLESLEIQKKANRASAIFGGKFPHATAIFPGGCPQVPNIDHISSYRALISDVRNFIHQKYVPDIVAVAGGFPEYWEIGQSKGDFLKDILAMIDENVKNADIADNIMAETNAVMTGSNRTMEDLSTAIANIEATNKETATTLKLIDEIEKLKTLMGGRFTAP